MLQFMMVLMLLLFTGCAQKDGKPADVNTTVRMESPRSTLPEWGELNCQKERNCKDVILNLGWDELLRFLQTDFRSQRHHLIDKEEAIYQCGLIIGKAWTKDFNSNGMSPKLNDFLLQVIDPNLCLAQPDLDQKINNYFIQTKEYKNEIQ